MDKEVTPFFVSKATEYSDEKVVSEVDMMISFE